MAGGGGASWAWTRRAVWRRRVPDCPGAWAWS